MLNDNFRFHLQLAAHFPAGDTAEALSYFYIIIITLPAVLGIRREKTSTLTHSAHTHFMHTHKRVLVSKGVAQRSVRNVPNLFARAAFS